MKKRKSVKFDRMIGLIPEEVVKLKKFRKKKMYQKELFPKYLKSFASDAVSPKEFNAEQIKRFISAYKVYRIASTNKKFCNNLIKWCEQQKLPIVVGKTPLANIVSQALLGKGGNMASRNGQAIRILMLKGVVPKKVASKLQKNQGVKGFVEKFGNLISKRKSKSSAVNRAAKMPRLLWNKKLKDKAYELSRKEQSFKIVVHVKSSETGTYDVLRVQPLKINKGKNAGTPAKTGKLKAKKTTISGWDD